jgi:peroxiredoxin
MSRLGLLGLSVSTVLCLGCGETPAPVPPQRALTPEEAETAFREGARFLNFLDEVLIQPVPQTDLKSLSLVDTAGQPKILGDVAPGKYLVVVMTRGYNGAVCPYCSSQIARMIAKYQEIADRNAEVIVIYPVAAESERARYDEFLRKLNSIDQRGAEAPPPFPVLLDIGLKVVDTLGIRKDLSKPATYILDPTGSIRFAYVGTTLNDRPSVKAIVQQLEKLQSGDKAG